jgi:imidazolonepropionase
MSHCSQFSIPRPRKAKRPKFTFSNVGFYVYTYLSEDAKLKVHQRDDMPNAILLTNTRLADGEDDLVDIAIRDGRIAIIGTALSHDGYEVEDCEGRLVTPGLIDCHTHIIHGGDRTGEFEMRLEGATYQEIARAGGGIVSSVAATRALSAEELVAVSMPRIDSLLSEGVTTIEIKSGYGLSIGGEARHAARRPPCRDAASRAGRTTWLAAHAMPKDFDGAKPTITSAT